MSKMSKIFLIFNIYIISIISNYIECHPTTIKFIESYNNKFDNKTDNKTDNKYDIEISAIIIGHDIYKFYNNTNTNTNNESFNSRYINNVKYFYNGAIILKYKIYANNIFNCKINVIDEQINLDQVIRFIKINYSINTILNIYCNDQECIYKNSLCNIIPVNDEL